MSKQEALSYLKHNNNYFRLRSYRCGFDKVVGGVNDGKYIGLDFAMLQDLSVIDYELMQVLLPMTIDIEHFSKFELLERLGRDFVDTYEIVEQYLSGKRCSQYEGVSGGSLTREIDSRLNSCYINGLVSAYRETGYPVWVFTELITFGTFIDFWFSVSRYLHDGEFIKRAYELQAMKGLRNACAHNNRIINDLKSGKPRYNVSYDVRNVVTGLKFQDVNVKAKLSNERLQHIATTLYLHSTMASTGVRTNKGKQLRRLVERMYRNEIYYLRNDQIRTGFAFISGLKNGWFVN
ncbi:Abi family protein [Collinsella aerofaciens]|nr:Abi family protein [Collinsella aerofaciens]VWL64003.1 Abi-like protein [Collinsella aerofaciens]